MVVRAAEKIRARAGCSSLGGWGPFIYYFFNFLKILFIHERHRVRGRDTGRGRSRLPVGSPMWDLIRDSRITPSGEGRC